VAIFRELTVLGDEAEGQPLSDHDLLTRPFESFKIDSLSVMQYIMAIEDRFDVVLDEVAVQQCQTIAELAELVRRPGRD
jgi:acyl carrier protein